MCICASLSWEPTTHTTCPLSSRHPGKVVVSVQGVTLVLSSYQAWRYHPEGGSLHALASNMRQRLASFKNSELATAIEAFSALGFHPGNDLVQVRRNITFAMF